MKAYTDGARRKSVAACSYVLLDNSDTYVEGAAFILGQSTNNEAEYLGLILLLEWATKNSVEKLRIYSDSMLVVEQVHGNWQINNPKLKDLRSRAWGLLVRGGHTLEHVKGHAGNKGNEAADRLCNEAMDRYENTLKGQVMDHA